MKVIYTDEALGDLDEILSFLASNYPSISAAVEILHIHHAVRQEPDFTRE
jgi:plasmid stabilization system protein ParE